jgi:hypothetical protein
MWHIGISVSLLDSRLAPRNLRVHRVVYKKPNHVYIYIYICMYIILRDVPQCRQQKFSVTFGFVSAAGQQTPHHWPHHRPFCRPESNDGKEALWNGLVAANCRDDRY